VYEDGSTFSPSVLDMSEDDLLSSFMIGVSKSRRSPWAPTSPTCSPCPTFFANSYKNVVAVALECDEYSFPKADKIKEILR